MNRFVPLSSLASDALDDFLVLRESKDDTDIKRSTDVTEKADKRTTEREEVTHTRPR